MANETPSWGEQRIVNELLLKIGIRVFPRTVNKYLPLIVLRQQHWKFRGSQLRE
jgi:hypothetical protein